jgi:alpha-beta hydrolase superfamily lysophospholipase
MSASLEPSSSIEKGVPLRTYLAANDSRRGAVLFFHGLRVSSETLDREARALAAAGVTAILPDAPHHGARRSTVLDGMPDTSTPEGYKTLVRILREARDEVPMLVEHVLGSGYERVAIAGVSMGAYIALAAATIEPRLAAIVSILGSPDWTPRGRESADFPDALADSPHLCPQAFPPRPLLLLNGGADENVPPEPARIFAARLRPLYDASGGGPLVHEEYPGVAHAVPEAIWRKMIASVVAFVGRVFTGG